MTNRPRQEPTPPPDKTMTGTCRGCGLVTETHRAHTTLPTQVRGPDRRSGEVWAEMPYCECRRCGARVYLSSRKAGG